MVDIANSRADSPFSRSHSCTALVHVVYLMEFLEVLDGRRDGFSYKTNRIMLYSGIN